MFKIVEKLGRFGGEGLGLGLQGGKGGKEKRGIRVAIERAVLLVTRGGLQGVPGGDHAFLGHGEIWRVE